MAESIREKYLKMNEGLSREEITRRAIQAMKEINEESKRNGLSDMTIEEINAEIYAARRKSEAKSIQSEKEHYKAYRALQIIHEIQEESERNGLSNMTLEEINAEIYAARREMEAENQ